MMQAEKLKEYRLVRVSEKVEECYVMAESWEDAERKAVKKTLTGTLGAVTMK